MKLNVKGNMFITAKGLTSSSCGTYGFMNMNSFVAKLILAVSKYDGLPTLILAHIYGLLFYVFPFISYIHVLAR